MYHIKKARFASR